MRPVLDTCQPKPELLAGTFNPEVFTASLSPIMDYYRKGTGAIDSIYTNAELFFSEATYPTQGLRQALTEIFSRLAGDMSVPAIHRLETAFGGGKTHTLIACAHLAYRGTELRDVVQDICNPQLLPEPGSVAVVGIAGDEIPVHRPMGEDLVPYTLWGEIAYQVGGESLYREVEAEASSHAAPGKPFLDKVFQNRKVLIMLDELAQYAARLEAARPDGAGQLAAFLMLLHGYARNHKGIAIVLTLASAADAFAKQTERLAKLLSQVKGQDVSEDDAISIGEQAVKGVASVVARDAVQITPVHAAEISALFAKRLFVVVDREAAMEAAEKYLAMYRRNASLLPEEAINEQIKTRIIATYPFHPTLVDFLNQKLAAAENFQGTRGVLRVLALAVRSLWQKKQAIPMIHTCHLDLRSDRVVNEILGRTGSSDLMYALNTDVGSVDTGTLEGGRSNAELADARNPHPEGYPLYEYTWKTVFLHSLVGREEGLNSRIFGITESDALFSVALPGLTPPQVRMALEEINESAFYLRYEQGRYFASDEPTINSVLARIRRTVTADQIQELLKTTARKMIANNSSLFHIEHDVALPEHLPDGKNRPLLGVVSLSLETLDVKAMITTKGENKPREQQNLIFLLIPETVAVQGVHAQDAAFDGHLAKVYAIRQNIEGIARQVLAMKRLVKNPQNFGVNPRRLEEPEFRRRYSERENSLQTAVAGIYTKLYYPSTKGYVISKEIKTAGGEGGTPFMEMIRQALIRDKELLTVGSTTKEDLLNLSKLFFEFNDTITLENIRRNFWCVRRWPVLENLGVLEQVIRAGVQEGIWCLYRMDEENAVKPRELYDQDSGIPMDIALSEPYSLITVQGAKQRGWIGGEKVDPHQLRQEVTYSIERRGPLVFREVAAKVAEQNSDCPVKDVEDAVVTLVRMGQLVAYQGTPEQSEKPDRLHYGPLAALYTPHPDDVFITPAQARERGWVDAASNRIVLSGKEGAEKLLPFLKRLGSIYNRGAKSTISEMDLVDLELPGGGTVRLQLRDVSPDSMKALGELFETLDAVAEKGPQTDVFLEINDPDDQCLLIQELNINK
ncbi:MAG: ATP-binding protein [Clostridia bacterium]|nr:ATP-binding protein [Clostridia bacterium]